MGKSATEINFFSQKVQKVLQEESSISPEQKLWRAVLGQVLDDAFGNTISNKMKCEKQIARDYLKSLNKDYILVCDWAGFDAGFILRKVRKKLAEEWIDLINKKGVENHVETNA